MKDIVLSTTKNTRFLGYENSRIIRSDGLFDYNENDILILKQLLVSTIIDLRSCDETLKTPCAYANCEDINYINISLHENGVLPQNAAKISDFYVEMASSHEKVGNILKAVAYAPSRVLLQCHAGKDRTGVISAIILSICGYSDEEIADDYSLSAEKLKDAIDKWLLTHPEACRDTISAKHEFIMGFLKLMRETYMDINSYLYECRITKKEINSIKSKCVYTPQHFHL